MQRTVSDVELETQEGKFEALPLVSALVPCYNSEAFIDATLDSLAAQTWPNLEIVIADDASNDDTRARLEAFATGRTDTRLVLRDRNLGWLANTNALMAEARGEFMFFAFHDDLLMPNYVEALVTALNEDPAAVLAFCDVELTEHGGSSKLVTFNRLEGVSNSFRRGIIMSAEPPGWWVPNRGIFRSSAFYEIGGIRRPKGGEVRADWVWLLEMAFVGRFIHVPGALCQKFYKPTSLSKNWKVSAERVAAARRVAIAGVMESRLNPLEKVALSIVLISRLVTRYAGRRLNALLGGDSS